MAIACADGTAQIIDIADTLLLTVSASQNVQRSCISLGQGTEVKQDITSLQPFQCAALGWQQWAPPVAAKWEADTGPLTGSFICSANAVRVIKWAVYKESRRTLVIGDIAGDCSFHYWECGSTEPEPDRRRLSDTNVARVNV